jgi:hypothetical protein
MPVLDPKTHTATMVRLQVRDPKTPSEGDTPAAQPSPLLGRRGDLDGAVGGAQLRDGQAEPRLDCRARAPESDGGVLQSGLRSSVSQGLPADAEQPPDADVRPEDQEGHADRPLLRHASPELRQQRRALVHGAGQVEGWFDTKIYDKTGDEAKAQGWSPIIVDTNGNGKRDAYVESISRSIPRRTSGSTRVLRRGSGV